MPDQSRSPRPTDETTGKRATKTQAERSAATRELLLAAAINCLFEYGYGPTTTTLVASVAGVSRGAMLHQFPTKADLMIFVVEATFADEVVQYRELLGDIDDRHERLLAYPAAVWRIMGRPEGVAVLEIFTGLAKRPGAGAQAGSGSGTDRGGRRHRSHRGVPAAAVAAAHAIDRSRRTRSGDRQFDL